MDHAEEEDSEDDSGSKKRKAKKKNRKESDTEKSGKNEKDSNDRKRKKDEKSSRKEGKIRASLKWFRRTKNFHTTVQSLRLSGNEEEIKKRADYQQRMLLRHGVINTAKISAGIIKIIASNVLLLLPIISLFLLLSLLFLGVKAERQSASSAYDGACYLAAKYESRIRLVVMAEMHVVNFSSTIVMSLGRLFGGAMKKIQLHMVRLNHILA